MALYKTAAYLVQTNHQNFDELHGPGARVPDSGIYRCEVCGHEISHNVNDPLPPQNHHQHPAGKGPIKWRLIVAAQTR